eukprot:TRINITY_DN94785_c0_g1_i1.p1 TRINITY_DN94785_c0_g1~~TRINITY_DN94785_c0_g1_i1.p1  ORF type:complete len:238 (+),score=77.60 TRINITY_DN94785_c0_g1_i1:31-714(+)
MAKLADALREAAALAGQDDRSFSSECPSILTKLKRGLSEVKKSPGLLEQVPGDIDAWPFLLRVSSEKASFAKQVWETSLVLLGSPAWASSFATQEHKERLNLCKAGARDAPIIAELVAKLLAAGSAEVSELIAEDAVEGLDPALCTAILGSLKDPVPAALAEAALGSDVGRALALRAAAQPAEGEAKRKVVAPNGKDSVGKDADLPVYVCEGISGSHQKMEIKKGLV